MGAAGSIRRSMQAEIERLKSRELDLIEEHDEVIKSTELKHEAQVTQLEAEKFKLAESLRDATTKLNTQTEKWKREQAKALSLMFSDLPLHLLHSEKERIQINSMMTRTFQKVTVARCGVAGFASLTARLPPEQVIHVIDRLHAIIDEAFTDSDIFIMDRTSDGCIAASGLVDSWKEKLSTPLSPVDRSYRSERDTKVNHKENECTLKKSESHKQIEVQPASYYAGKMATAALKLLSYSTTITVPLPENQTLQLRIALHSGTCSAGVIGLQTTTGTARTPHYKLFGPTMRLLQTIYLSSLALQIRVSKQCRDLLTSTGGYILERCPDYRLVSSQQPLESYWLVAKVDFPLKLPSLSDAMPLCDYEDLNSC